MDFDANAALQFFSNYPWLTGVLITWSMVIKAVALWHAARNRQLAWYVVLVVINTLGILEVVYLLFFRNKKRKFRRP